MALSTDIPSMAGQACLVTGATSGIGYVAARELARAGARVLLAGRTEQTAGDAVRRIIEEFPSARVEPVAADFSSQAAIRSLAAEVARRSDRLDVLLNNAGGIWLDRREGADGVEMTFAVNHLAPFLLTNLLLPLLKATPGSRIVNVASGAHRGVSLRFDDLEGRNGYHGWRAYQRSKLANILFTRELARRIGDASVVVNCLHPGFVATQIFRGGGPIAALMRGYANFFGLTPEQGADTAVYLAASPDSASVTGEYFVKRRQKRPSRQALDDADARRLWEISSTMVGLVDASP